MASDGAGDADMRDNSIGVSGRSGGGQNNPAASPGVQNQQQQPNLLESAGAARSQAVVARGEQLEVRKVTGLSAGRVKRKKDGQ